MASNSVTELEQKLNNLHVNLENLANLKCDFLQRYYSTETPPSVRLSDFTLYSKLGKGAFATVYYAVDTETKTKKFALKVLNKAKAIRDKQVDHVISEKRLLTSLRSDFIISLNHRFQDETYLYLALELVPGGELFRLIRARLYFSEETAKFYSMQIILAIEYLHHLEIVYRDIKPENVLIATNGYLKLADFGFAKLMLDNRTYTLCGTPEYLAPETILNMGYGQAVDWWGIGVFIYELLGGHTPFYQPEIKQIYEKIVLCKYKFPVHFSTDAKSLIRKLLEPDLSRRLGNLRKRAFDVKNHRWFMCNNSANWVTIHSQTQSLPKEIALHKIPLDSEFTKCSPTVLECIFMENEKSKVLFKDF